MTKKYYAFFLTLLFTSILVQGQNKKPVSNKKPAATQEKPAAVIAPGGNGHLEFDYLKYDFININEKGGRVYHDFRFVNLGTGPITIKNVQTSCGCTNSDWTRTPVLPGDSGIVRATFDPNGRQGKFDKSLVVETDGSPASISLTIKGHVYPSKMNFVDTYKYQYGNLAVITNSLTFNNVKNTGYDSSEIGMYNLSNKKIYVYKIETPGNIMATKPYDNLPPNTDMRIKVKYYPRQPIEFGPIRQEIKIYTNDDSIPIKKFYVSANVVEDFSNLTKKDLKKAAKFSVKSAEIDLGNVPLFNTPTATFTITNKGKKDLIIRKVIRSCSCLSPDQSSMVIPKGKSANLNVVYSLANMAGTDTKTLKLITNDPTQTEITLTIKINVTE
ncbi:MAG: DUF1573 domain-containing protein [Bacteroidia bacterium]|nr:DUF1573 domain-containing protein [Bacteroidia bacterium]MCF8425447.1 DUF1573 domain-containing protein [Bacteroidia bacterium]MCF8446271.1 DUF1573 domain-containing protein [Bacteroidia bacterium]